MEIQPSVRRNEDSSSLIHNRARPLRSPSTTSLSEKVDERTLNNLGYTLLYSRETQDAITVFKRNVQEIHSHLMYATALASLI